MKKKSLVSLTFCVATSLISWAAAQAPRGLASVSNCSAEPTAKAIDPRVIECFAKKFPIPTVPPEIDAVGPNRDAHIEYLRSQGDELLRQLDRPEACGPSAKLGPDDMCAIVVYLLDPARRQIGVPRAENFDGPWVYIAKVYRVVWTEALRNSVIVAIESNGHEVSLSVGAKKEPWTLVAEQRANQTGCMAGASDPNTHRRHDCHHVEGDVRYIPALVVGLGEAGRVFHQKVAVKNYFSAPRPVIQDLEKMLRPECLIEHRDC